MRALFTLLLAAVAVPAQVVKTLDVATTDGRQAYYVVLAARDGSATGHAFVVWGVEDDKRKMSTMEALGLYPENTAYQCNTAIRTVSGRVMDEMANHSVQFITYALIVRVDEADFRRSRKVARAWDCRHEFSLLNRDCVEFLRAVGASLHLQMPKRGVTRWTPQSYVRALQVSAGDGSLVGR